MMIIHVLPLYEHFDQALHCPLLVDGDRQRLTATHRAITTLLVFECVRIYTIRANDHEVVVQIRG